MSVIKDIYKDLIKSEDLSLEKILAILLKSDDNLALKTQVDNPLGLSILSMLAEYLKTKKLKISSKLLKGFIKLYLEYMVSYKRMSRKEIIEGMKSLYQYEKDKEMQKNELMRRY